MGLFELALIELYKFDFDKVNTALHSYTCLYLPDKSDLELLVAQALIRLQYVSIKESDACLHFLDSPQTVRAYDPTLPRYIAYLALVSQCLKIEILEENWPTRKDQVDDSRNLEPRRDLREIHWMKKFSIEMCG